MYEKLYDAVINNLKNPRLYIVILLVILVFLLLFPYIDANYFYYHRVNNWIEIVTKMMSIDKDKIRENSVLMKEYENLLVEIEKQYDGSIGNVFVNEKNPSVQRIKFITGGSLVWLLAIMALVSKGNTFRNRIITAVVLAVIGCVTGGLSKIIPTIISPIVNYIGFPMVLIVLLALMMTGTATKKAKGKTNKEEAQ